MVLAWRLPHAFNVPLMVGAHAALALLAVHYTRVGICQFTNCKPCYLYVEPCLQSFALSACGTRAPSLPLHQVLCLVRVSAQLSLAAVFLLRSTLLTLRLLRCRCGGNPDLAAPCTSAAGTLLQHWQRRETLCNVHGGCMEVQTHRLNHLIDIDG